MDVDVECLYGVNLAIGDAILRGQMEDDVDAPVQRVTRLIADITPVEFDTAWHLLHYTVRQVVDSDHTVSLTDESLGQVASNEASDPRDEERGHVIEYSAARASE
jgi:hypothetical protein